jgi:MerR family regulatory protein
LTPHTYFLLPFHTVEDNREYADDDLVRVSIAARMIGVSRETMRKYGDDGLLPVRRTPGGQRRFRVGDLRGSRPRAAETPATSAPSVPRPRSVDSAPPDDGETDQEGNRADATVGVR